MGMLAFSILMILWSAFWLYFAINRGQKFNMMVQGICLIIQAVCAVHWFHLMMAGRV